MFYCCLYCCQMNFPMATTELYGSTKFLSLPTMLVPYVTNNTCLAPRAESSIKDRSRELCLSGGMYRKRDVRLSEQEYCEGLSS